MLKITEGAVPLRRISQEGTVNHRLELEDTDSNWKQQVNIFIVITTSITCTYIIYIHIYK